MANPAVTNSNSVQIVVAGNPGAIQASLVVPAANSATGQGQLALVDATLGLIAKLPTGSFVPYASATTLPASGYLVCDGTAVSRSTFAALFALIGTQYGVGDGSTTFNLPDLHGRSLVGSDPSNTRITRSLWATPYGSSLVTISLAQIALHDHNIANGVGVYTNSGPAPGYGNVDAYAGGATVNRYAFPTVAAQGGNAGHNNLHPAAAVRWLVAV